MDDDHVAQVLAKEARDSSRKYSTEGLGAFLPRKPAGNAPKPNTRFLRHLIKETDNHNTALKRKEEREARERMRQLRDQSTAGSASTSHASRRHNRHSSTRDSERHRNEDRGERHISHRRRHRSRSSSTERDRSRRHRRSEDYDRIKGRHKDRDHEERRRDRHRHESSRAERRRRERSYSRSRSRSPRRDCTSGHHRGERRPRRSESPSGTRSSRSHRGRRHRRAEDSPERHRKTTNLRERESPPSVATVRDDDPNDESDPLEDLIGPLPAQVNGEHAPSIRSRGRGAYKPNSSTIDAHFAPDYDPTLDVQPDDEEHFAAKQSTHRPVAGLTTEEDDWDMALEALRDRANWRQKGEERLRAAGMNEATIDRWKSNAAFAGMDGAGAQESVRWSKKGEGREWDRGKVVDDEGHIDVRAAWR